MTPVSYYAPDELSSPRFAYAFARGCHGAITDEPELFDGPVALFGSPSRWPLLRQAQQEGRDWYYADHGYFGRGRYYRVTKNAYQHDGRGTYGPERFQQTGRQVLPWTKAGGHVLICPNSAIYFQLHGLDVQSWIDETCTTLRAHTDRELRVRWKTSSGPIKEDLRDAWAVVVFSSAAAIDALLAGIPCFVTAPFSAPYRMGSSDLSQIEQPVYPDDREPFLWALAANQWTLPEMIEGLAWQTFREGN